MSKRRVRLERLTEEEAAELRRYRDSLEPGGNVALAEIMTRHSCPVTHHTVGNLLSTGRVQPIIAIAARRFLASLPAAATDNG